ncbi:MULTISPECIES: YfcZ/YiiS family protein [Glaesserella]|uniref:DUF406 domain-containing protein n=1 Tax=Glaesserella australis TaxID=2094024 RepID=A0A328BWY6_9PAST|nr:MULTISPECIES: YfcZ/YiiS family protein [Glaesserella]AUI66039.1 hypothetical protein CJD39_05360 [Glaesserella sp. 15-184]RAL18241.1 hypothetical protein C5N92_08440 [Glaesserella australis]
MTDKVNETETCCSVDVGNIIDNSDCVAEISQVYKTESEAQDALDYFVSKANAAASEPCQITSEIKSVESGYQLDAKFAFSYQVETMIFQLSIR